MGSRHRHHKDKGNNTLVLWRGSSADRHHNPPCALISQLTVARTLPLFSLHPPGLQ